MRGSGPSPLGLQPQKSLNREQAHSCDRDSQFPICLQGKENRRMLESRGGLGDGGGRTGFQGPFCYRTLTSVE